jgi:hypothetical protein
VRDYLAFCQFVVALGRFRRQARWRGRGRFSLFGFLAEPSPQIFGDSDLAWLREHAGIVLREELGQLLLSVLAGASHRDVADAALSLRVKADVELELPRSLAAASDVASAHGLPPSSRRLLRADPSFVGTT